MSHIWEQENPTRRARRSTWNEESSWLELPAIPGTGGTVKNRACVIVVGILSFVAAPAFTGTTGQLGGFVFDEGELPLQGVSVSASSPSQIGAVQTTTTGTDGSFRFPRLTPGYYTVLVEKPGFAPRQLEQVQVRLDRVTNVQVVLPQTAFSDSIEVFETTPVIDSVQVSIDQTFTTDYITKTSTDWSNLITQTAGASQNFRRVLGSTPQDGAYLLDGIDSTNWYQRFPNPAALNLPFDAIQEVAVHTAGFEAEFGQATGAVVNVSTKSGGNAFHGTFDARYTGSSFETSGDHYDPNEQESEDARFAATLGGPILKDRLWFFTSIGRTTDKNTPTGAPTTVTDKDDIFLGKLTWHASPSWSVIAKYSYAPNSTDNEGTSQFTAPEATSIWERTPDIATLEAVGILTPSLLWDIWLSRKTWYETGLPHNDDFESIRHYNASTREATGNWGSQWYGDSFQNEIATDLTWFFDSVAGSHEVKAGLSIGDPKFIDDWCLNGSGQRCAFGVEGYYFRDLADEADNSVPYLMEAGKAEGEVEYGGKFYSAFAQDAWRLLPNLTAKLGARWDRVTYDNQLGQIADLSKFQPRAGIAWDISNNGRTMLRASWGRFMHPGTTLLAALTNETNHPTEYWLSCSTILGANAEECAAFADSNSFGYRNDPENWDEAGWFLTPGNVFSTEPGRANENLSAGYADEWLIGLERALTRRTSIELTYVNKASRNMFDDTCNGNIPEPNADAACDFYEVVNIPDIKWDYKGLMLRFESRALDNLHLLASWVISESKGSMDYNTSATSSFDVYPYHFVNRYGYLEDHSRHRVKLNGYWLLPYDFSLAFDGWWESEFRWTPYDPTVPGMPYGSQYVEPRGSGKGGSLHQVDLQFSKGFRAGPTRLVVLATVINATNSQTGDEICGSVTGCGDFEFGGAIEWQQPRRYELGFRVEF